MLVHLTSRLARIRQVVVLLLWLAMLGFLFGRGLDYGPTWDFMNVWRAAEAVASGETLYDPRPAWDRGFVYGPVMAIALRPLLPLGPEVAYVIWILLSVIAVGGSAALTGLALRRSSGRGVPAWVLLLPALFLISPLASNFKYGNSNAFLMALVAVGFWGTAASAPRVGGAALALAAAIKVAPGIFFAWLLARRDWAGCAGFVFGALLWLGVIPVLVLGPERATKETLQWGRQILRPVVSSAADPARVVRGPGHSLHWAVESLVGRSPLSGADARREGHPSLDLLPAPAARVLGQSLALVIVLVTLAASWLDRGDGTLSFGVMSAAMLLVSPVSRSAHYVQVYPYLGLLCAWAFLGPFRFGRSARTVLLCGLATMIIAFLAAAVTGNRSNAFFPLTGMGLALWCGGVLIAKTQGNPSPGQRLLAGSE